jgi:hypothetical protein
VQRISKVQLLKTCGLACSGRPKPPIYSNDPYSSKRAEAFTLNFFLVVTRSKSSTVDFDVALFDRASDKEIDVASAR